MAVKSRYRGNKIERNDGNWIYSDTKELVRKNKKRSCGNCGKIETEQGHDACLGTLPGLMNACCGHGIDSEAYIQFLDSTIIRGSQALKIAKEMRASEIEKL